MSILKHLGILTHKGILVQKGILYANGLLPPSDGFGDYYQWVFKSGGDIVEDGAGGWQIENYGTGENDARIGVGNTQIVTLDENVYLQGEIDQFSRWSLNEYKGTSTPTIDYDNDVINVTAGNLEWIELINSDGVIERIWFQESDGIEVYSSYFKSIELVIIQDVFSTAINVNTFEDISGDGNDVVVKNNRSVSMNSTDNFLRAIGVRVEGQTPIKVKRTMKLEAYDGFNIMITCGATTASVRGFYFYFEGAALRIRSADGSGTAIRSFTGAIEQITLGEYFELELNWTGLTIDIPTVSINNGSPIPATGTILEWVGNSNLDLHYSFTSGGLSNHDFSFAELENNGNVLGRYYCFENSQDLIYDSSGQNNHLTVNGTKTTIRDGRYDGEAYAYTRGFSVNGSDIIVPDDSNPGFDIDGNELTHPPESGIIDILPNTYVIPVDPSLNEVVSEGEYSWQQLDDLPEGAYLSKTKDNTNQINRFVVKKKLVENLVSEYNNSTEYNNLTEYNA